MRYKFLLLFISAISFSFAQDSCRFEQKIFPSVSTDLMGVAIQDAISIYGDYTVLGSFNDSGTGKGAVFVYKRCGSVWSEVDIVAPDQLEDGDRFGWSVSLWGDYLVVGAPHDGAGTAKYGAAYVFHLEDGEWVLQQKIFASEGGYSSAWFGSTVCIWQDYVIVGAQYDANVVGLTGSAYIYKRNGESWAFQKKLLPPDLGANDKFGFSVDIHDDLAIVGAQLNDDDGEDSGSAYIFGLDGEEWVFRQKLLPSIGAAGDNFGLAVAISSQRALVGSPRQDGLINNGGAVYVYKSDDNILWTQESILYSPEVINDENFGATVEHDEERVLVGSSRGFGLSEQTGVAYLFDENAGVWDYKMKLFSNDGDHADFFSSAMSMYHNTMLIGSFGDDSNAGNAGSAALFYIDCTPMCTSLTSPLNTSILDVAVDTLEWCGVELADGYNIGVGTSAGMDDIYSFQDIGDTTSWIINLENEMDYYVTIQPYNDAGTNSTCPTDMFTIDYNNPPTCPTLTSPTGNGNDINTVLVWDSVDDVTGYIISVGTSAGASDVISAMDVGLENTLSVNDLPTNSVIYVSIIAYNENGNAESCEEYQFQTGPNAIENPSQSDMQVVLYPNPTRDGIITLEIDNSSVLANIGGADISVWDMTGRRVSAELISNSMNGLDAEYKLKVNSEAGLYLLKLSLGEASHNYMIEILD